MPAHDIQCLAAPLPSLKQRDLAKEVLERGGAKDISTGRESGISGKDKAA